MPRSLHLPAVLKAPLPSGPRVRTIPLGPARGLDFTIDFDRHLRFFLGLYETELAPWLARFATSGTVAYDVGADVGYQALVIARLTQAPVVAFEPRDDAAAQIERHYELNRDRVGPVEVVRRIVGRRIRPARTTTLDDFAARSPLGAPGLLLVDVDGGEVEVLSGADAAAAQRQAACADRDPLACARGGLPGPPPPDRLQPGDRQQPALVRRFPSDRAQPLDRGRRTTGTGQVGAAMRKKRSASVSAAAS